jgi:hypothetical protein
LLLSWGYHDEKCTNEEELSFAFRTFTVGFVVAVEEILGCSATRNALATSRAPPCDGTSKISVTQTTTEMNQFLFPCNQKFVIVSCVSASLVADLILLYSTFRFPLGDVVLFTIGGD